MDERETIRRRREEAARSERERRGGGREDKDSRREAERPRERERERERGGGEARERSRERDKPSSAAKEKDKERERERERERDKPRSREREEREKPKERERERERDKPRSVGGSEEELGGGDDGGGEATAALAPSAAAVAEAVLAFVASPVELPSAEARDARLVAEQLRFAPTHASLVGQEIAAAAAAARGAGGVAYALDATGAHAAEEEVRRLMKGVVTPAPAEVEAAEANMAAATKAVAPLDMDALFAPCRAVPPGAELATLRSGGKQLMPLPLETLREAAAPR